MCKRFNYQASLEGDKSYVFIIPVYNEAPIVEQSIRLLYTWLVSHWENRTKDWKIVLADNGSTDNTKEIVSKLKTEFGNRIDYFFVSVAGRGNTLRKTVEHYAANIYFYTDVDVPVELEHIPAILEPVEREATDVVVGKRNGERPLLRRLLTWGLRQINFLLFNVSFSDVQCGAKAFNKKAAGTLICKCLENGYFLDSEFLILSRTSGLRVAEVPIQWIETRYSDRASKIRPLRDSFRAFRALWRIRQRLY